MVIIDVTIIITNNLFILKMFSVLFFDIAVLLATCIILHCTLHIHKITPLLFLFINYY